MLDLFNGEDLELVKETNEKWKEKKFEEATRPKFGRPSSFDEDIMDMITKYKGTKYEVLVRHMVDSLILFNHNRNQVEDAYAGDKFGSTEVWKAIQLQLNS